MQLSHSCSHYESDQCSVRVERVNTASQGRGELTAELVEVCLDLPPGVEEDSAFFCADSNHTVLVYGDTGHLSVELGHRHALQNRDTGITGNSRVLNENWLLEVLQSHCLGIENESVHSSLINYHRVLHIISVGQCIFTLTKHIHRFRTQCRCLLRCVLQLFVLTPHTKTSSTTLTRVMPALGRTTESRADTRLVRISCLADTSGTAGSPREFVLMPSHANFLIWAMPLWGPDEHSLDRRPRSNINKPCMRMRSCTHAAVTCIQSSFTRHHFGLALSKYKLSSWTSSWHRRCREMASLSSFVLVSYQNKKRLSAQAH